jgi:hypothetical protein
LLVLTKRYGAPQLQLRVTERSGAVITKAERSGDYFRVTTRSGYYESSKSRIGHLCVCADVYEMQLTIWNARCMRSKKGIIIAGCHFLADQKKTFFSCKASGAQGERAICKEGEIFLCLTHFANLITLGTKSGMEN